MSADATWHGQKWTGSPKKLYKQNVKKAVKAKRFSVTDPELLQDHIMFGWYFHCSCGASGKNYDDGKRSLQCDVCKVWMHNKCNNVPSTTDELFFFFDKTIWVCNDCKEGNFQYKGKTWCTESKMKKQSSITFAPHPFPKHNSVYDTTILPGAPILKPSHRGAEELKKPIPSPMRKRRSFIPYVISSFVNRFVQ